MRFKTMLAVAIGAMVLALAAACGGGDEKAAPPSPTAEPPVSSGGSVAPDVFMTFEGKRYRARDVGSDLVSRDHLVVAGATEQIDIDHTGPVEVYRLDVGPTDVLYTFSPGRELLEGEGGATPDVWLEWAPAVADEADSGQAEPGSAGGAVPGGEPGSTPSEPIAPPPGSGPTLGPDEPVSATPAPGTETRPDASMPVEAAVAHLAQRLGVAVETIEVVSVEPVDWPDGCLGAGAPDEACILMITPGYQVVLAVDGTQYVYHTDTTVRVRPAP